MAPSLARALGPTQPTSSLRSPLKNAKIGGVWATGIGALLGCGLAGWKAAAAWLAGRSGESAAFALSAAVVALGGWMGARRLYHGAVRDLVSRCIEQQAKEVRHFRPDVVLGSSFGGGIALMLMNRGVWRGPTVLLAPAAAKVTRHAMGNVEFALTDDAVRSLAPLVTPTLPPATLLARRRAAEAASSSSLSSSSRSTMGFSETTATAEERTGDASLLIVHSPTDAVVPVADSHSLLSDIAARWPALRGGSPFPAVGLEEPDDVHALRRVSTSDALEHWCELAVAWSNGVRELR